MSSEMRKKLVVLGTGGTIAGTAATAGDNIGYTAAQVGIAQLLQAVPALNVLPFELLSEQVAQLDSKDMDFGVWQNLAERANHWLAQPDVLAVVITHGTDTLEETAWFLQSVLDPDRLACKPVVLTCAMRPATALVPDGPQNLMDAMAVAGTPQACGVVVVCAGVVHTARDVQKTHPYRTDAFGSGDAGPLAYVEEGVVRQLKDWPGKAGALTLAGGLPWGPGSTWPRVDIVMSYAGARGGMVDALVKDGVRGLVVACTGNGTVHDDLQAALLRAVAAGVAVVRATRCPSGRIISQRTDALPDSDGLSPVKARIALLLSLMTRNFVPPGAEFPQTLPGVV